MFVRKILVALGLTLLVLPVMLSILVQRSQTSAQASNNDYRIRLPFIARGLLEGEEFYIGQRSSSQCAEHDSYIVPIVTPLENNTMPAGTEVTARYRIRATHPQLEEHPLNAMWTDWCCCDEANCPGPCPPDVTPCVIDQQVNTSYVDCRTARLSAQNVIKVFDNVQEQIYVFDGPSDIGSFEVIVNGHNEGHYAGVIFGSRWGSAESWNHDGVIYANGFTRWKPKGEEPGAETDPCFGTSVVLGPFQIDEPFESDGYSPNPVRHPKIEVINITVGTGWEAQMSGAFFEGEQRLMNVSWSIERLNISSSEMLVAVSQNATALLETSLYQIRGQFGIGQIEISSMFAEPQKHDSDSQIGPGYQIWAGDISNSNEGLWGQETGLHQLPEGNSICLETTTPTTHNTGSPTLCILWDSGDIQ